MGGCVVGDDGYGDVDDAEYDGGIVMVLMVRVYMHVIMLILVMVMMCGMVMLGVSMGLHWCLWLWYFR